MEVLPQSGGAEGGSGGGRPGVVFGEAEEERQDASAMRPLDRLRQEQREAKQAARCDERRVGAHGAAVDSAGRVRVSVSAAARSARCGSSRRSRIVGAEVVLIDRPLGREQRCEGERGEGVEACARKGRVVRAEQRVEA